MLDFIGEHPILQMIIGVVLGLLIIVPDIIEKRNKNKKAPKRKIYTIDIPDDKPKNEYVRKNPYEDD